MVEVNAMELIRQKPKPKEDKTEKPVPEVYPVIDTDLARDNLENDIPAIDLDGL